MLKTSWWLKEAISNSSSFSSLFLSYFQQNVSKSDWAGKKLLEKPPLWGQIQSSEKETSPLPEDKNLVSKESHKLSSQMELNMNKLLPY